MDRFKIRGQVSSGAHGVIYKAVRRGHLEGAGRVTADNYLAIKRIFVKGKKLPVSLVREIKSLQLLTGHVNVSVLQLEENFNEVY